MIEGWFYTAQPVKWRTIAVAIPPVLVDYLLLGRALDALFGTARLREVLPGTITSSGGAAGGAFLAALVKRFERWWG